MRRTQRTRISSFRPRRRGDGYGRRAGRRARLGGVPKRLAEGTVAGLRIPARCCGGMVFPPYPPLSLANRPGCSQVSPVEQTPQ